MNVNRTPFVRKAPVDLTRCDEPALKALVSGVLGPSFEMREEVDGTFTPDGSRVRIDYVLKASQPLVASGFTDQWFGLEVKAVTNGGKKQALAYAWQAITYSLSTFDGIRPAFVLMFLPLRQILGTDADGYAHYFEALLQRSNVGGLFMRGDAPYQWRMVFGGQTYFSARGGLGGQPQAALKRRVGNSK